MIFGSRDPERRSSMARNKSTIVPESAAKVLGRLDSRGLLGEFKEFINKGNVIDLAVAFVMGAAFKTVIDALAGNGSDNPGILGGLIGAAFGGTQPDFSQKVLTVNGSNLPIGAFVTASLNFLIIGFAMFLIVKASNRFKRRQEADGVAEPSTNELLAEIRDELRAARGAG
jgi:large conductance mechanosensitive channel